MENEKNDKHFFWIPQHLWKEGEINFYFENGEGLFYSLPVFSTIKDYEKTFNRHAERSFNYMRSKLNDGSIKGMKYWYDTHSNLPVFFADLNKSH